MAEEPFKGYLSNKSYGESLVLAIKDNVSFFKNTGLDKKLSKSNGPFVDLGCSIGNELSAFQKGYPHLKTMGIDINKGYLKEAKKNSPKSKFIYASLRNIPLPNNSIPILFSSRIFQWCNKNKAIDEILHETYRILKPENKGIYIMLLEDFIKKEENKYFIQQVKDKGFKILKNDLENYGMILQKPNNKKYFYS